MGNSICFCDDSRSYPDRFKNHSVVAVTDMDQNQSLSSSFQKEKNVLYRVGEDSNDAHGSDSCCSSNSADIKENPSKGRIWSSCLRYKWAILVVLFCVVYALATRFNYEGSSTVEDVNYLSEVTTIGEKAVNDHMYIELDQLNLTPKQKQLVSDVYKSPKLHTKHLTVQAAAVGIRITPHLVYRYFRSSEWGKGAKDPKFYGKSYDDAIIETINFRKEYNLPQIDPKIIEPIVRSKLMYANGFDNKGRAIIYTKFEDKIENLTKSSDNYLKSVLLACIHSVEKADRMSTRKGSGEFVVIVDLNGLSWKTCPPIKTMGQAIGFLKKHFPYRLHKIYIINVGMVFDAIWGFIKPMVPPRALRKTIFLKRKADASLLLQEIGPGLELSYGGTTVSPDFENDRSFYNYATSPPMS